MTSSQNISSYSTATSSSSSFSSSSSSEKASTTNTQRRKELNDCWDKFLPITSRGRFIEDSFFKNVRALFDHDIRSIFDNWNRTEIIDDAWFRKGTVLCRPSLGRQLQSRTEIQDKKGFNVVTRDGNYTIIIDVGDLGSYDLNVRVSGENKVAMEGRMKQKNRNTGNTFPLKNVCYQFFLPENTNMDAITAALFSEGFLTITAPKLVIASSGSSSPKETMNNSAINKEKLVFYSKNSADKSTENLCNLWPNCHQISRMHSGKDIRMNTQLKREELFQEYDNIFTNNISMEGVEETKQVIDTSRASKSERKSSKETDSSSSGDFKETDFHNRKEEKSTRDERDSQILASSESFCCTSTLSSAEGFPVRREASSTESFLRNANTSFHLTLKDLLSKRDHSVKKVSEIIKLEEDHLRYVFALDVEDFLPDGSITLKLIGERELEVKCQGNGKEISCGVMNSLTERFVLPEDVQLDSTQSWVMNSDGFMIIVVPRKNQTKQVNEFIVPISFEEMSDLTRNDEESTHDDEEEVSRDDQWCRPSSVVDGSTNTGSDFHLDSSSDATSVSSPHFDESEVTEGDSVKQQVLKEPEVREDWETPEKFSTREVREQKAGNEKLNQKGGFIRSLEKESEINQHSLFEEENCYSQEQRLKTIPSENMDNGIQRENADDEQTSTLKKDDLINEQKSSPQVIDDSLVQRVSSDTVDSTSAETYYTATPQELPETHPQAIQYSPSNKRQTVTEQNTDMVTDDLTRFINEANDDYDNENDDNADDDNDSNASTVIDVPCNSENANETLMDVHSSIFANASDASIDSRASAVIGKLGYSGNSDDTLMDVNSSIFMNTSEPNYSVTLAESPCDLQRGPIPFGNLVRDDTGCSLEDFESYMQFDAGRPLCHQLSTLSIHTIDDSDINNDDSCNSSVCGLSSYPSVDDQASLDEELMAKFSSLDSSKNEQTHSDQTEMNLDRNYGRRKFEDDIEDVLRRQLNRAARQDSVAYAGNVEKCNENSKINRRHENAFNANQQNSSFATGVSKINKQSNNEVKFFPVIRKGIFLEDSFFQEVHQPFQTAVRQLLMKSTEEDKCNTASDLKSYRCLRQENPTFQNQAFHVLEDKNVYKVVLDVQDFTEGSLVVSVVDDKTLVVEGKANRLEGASASSQTSTRCFSLPEGVDLDATIAALSADGILLFVSPKMSHPGPGIPVNTTGGSRKEEEEVGVQTSARQSESSLSSPNCGSYQWYKTISDNS